MATDFLLILPEEIIGVVAMLLMLAAAWAGDRSAPLLTWLAVLTLAVAAAFIPGLLGPGGSAFDGLFVADRFAAFSKMVIYIAAAVSMLMAMSWFGRDRDYRAEYPVLILFSTLGMGMMVSASDLLTLYVGLELQSLAAYVLASFQRTDSRSAEAGLKYFVLGALASGILLYGISLLYGFTGTTSFEGIATAFGADGLSSGELFGLVFVLAGLAFKVAAVPFHMWTPDVYEGAPTPVTALFATAPKVAAMALMVRLVMDTFQPIAHDWQQIVIFLSIASMVLAAFAAIGQRSIKRLIAYSSIGHVGFALVGLSSGTEGGIEGVAIYMAIYVAMTVGLFACLLSLRTADGYVETIDDMAGAAQKRPFVAAIMAVMMFSLIGMPPLAGFFAKWHAFLAAIDAQLYVLAVLGVLASAVSAFYYLRVVKVMYFDEPVRQFQAVPAELNIIMAVSGFLLVTYYFTVG